MARPSRRLELVIALLGLVAALSALPLPTIGVTPELASVLAVSAIALLAGHRWGLAVVVLADVALVGALWPRAFLQDPPSTLAQIGVALGIAGALPGVIALRRFAPAIGELITGEATVRGSAISRLLVPAVAILWIASPLV